MKKISKIIRDISLFETIRKMGINPLNLSFKNADLEIDFNNFYYNKKINQIRIAFSVGIIIYIFFHLLDAILLPDMLQPFRIIRFYIVIPVISLIILFSFTKYFKNIFQPLISLAILIGGGGIIAMILTTKEPVSDTYYVGVILVSFAAYTFIGLRFIWATLTCWILAFIYFYVAFYYVNLDRIILINNIIFLFSSNFLGMATSYIIEFFIRRDYYFNKLLEDANDKVVKAKEQLEDIVTARTEELRKSYENLKKESEEKKELTEKQEELQKQLIQSQKMEAIGLLAGGVAHDFNNLLTVINGYSELLLLQHKNDKEKETINQIYNAGKKAETLTRQLLAFSRKQVMKQVVVDLNYLIKNIEIMLRHLVGENIDIIFMYENNIHKIMADPGQIEQVIVNLVINARDAMPDGGVIKIITENIFTDDLIIEADNKNMSSEMVCLSIIDTGMGMDNDVLSHIFEPFFTTKEKNKGTGLGLSTVYGIVKQTEGYIRVDSKTKIGTTFKIYFNPCNSNNKIKSYNKKNSSEQIDNIGNGILVLVVEDEDSVREFVEFILKNSGYRVITATDGNDGYKVFLEHKNEIDLLIADVIMPGMSGKALIDKILKIDPNIKYLFMSGYTDDYLGKHGIVSSNINIIQKPISREFFLSKIKEITEKNTM